MGRSLRATSLLATPLLAATLALAGCSGSTTTGTASPGPVQSAPASTAPSSTDPSGASSAEPSASASPSLATLPASECLSGTWQLVRFVAVGSDAYGTGQGGDVTVRFADGGYTLTGAGKEPVAVTLAGQTGRLTVDGRASGTYALDGARATFTDGTTSGSGTVELGGRSQRLSMDQVGNVIGLRGEGDVACTAQVMTITLASVRLELARA